MTRDRDAPADDRTAVAADGGSNAADGGDGDGDDADGEGRTVPVVEPGALDDAPHAGERTVGGVLLAAGPSTRFGDANKLLAELDGKPVVRHAAGTFVSSGLPAVAVVVGHEADRVTEALADLDVTVLENDAYRRGQSTSLHVGVEHARERGWGAVVFGLGDMPRVAPESVDALLAADRRDGRGTILAAANDGKRGNPVLFDARHYDDLLAIEGDTGGRPVLMGSDDLALVETGDPGVTRDVDYRDDLEALE